MDEMYHPDQRHGNVYFPFANAIEWELAAWLGGGNLSKQEINTFLRTLYVCISSGSAR